jgi:adenine-specific DNA-methyltransferase
MATGIVKGEKLSEDTLLAESAKSEKYPLPENNEEIIFHYPNKMSEHDVLEYSGHQYIKVLKKGSTKALDTIEPNSIILADNFFGLHRLSESLNKKINLVYMDPPYGTGMEFQSRNLKHAYKDVMGAASWLEFIRRRLILLRELMADDASIYVHIGHQMVFHLKIVMDEVFGASNFRNMIVRKKCSSKNYTKNQYPNLNDYILFYSKTKKYKWNMPGVIPSDEWVLKEYNKTDKKGRYKLVPIHAPGTRNGETGKSWKNMMPPPGKHWQLSPSKLDELDARGEIRWSKTGNPRRKVYLSADKLIPMTDYWDQFRDAHHQSIQITGYPTEKNLDMLKTIISASSDEGDLVLDPFCGSGTTLHAAGDLNRKWIGIDQSFVAMAASLNRMRNGLKPMGDYVNRDKSIIQNELFESSNLVVLPSAKKQHDFSFVVDLEVYEKHKSEILELASI